MALRGGATTPSCGRSACGSPRRCRDPAPRTIRAWLSAAVPRPRPLESLATFDVRAAPATHGRVEPAAVEEHRDRVVGVRRRGRERRGRQETRAVRRVVFAHQREERVRGRSVADRRADRSKVLGVHDVAQRVEGQGLAERRELLSRQAHEGQRCGGKLDGLRWGGQGRGCGGAHCFWGRTWGLEELATEVPGTRARGPLRTARGSSAKGESCESFTFVCNMGARVGCVSRTPWPLRGCGLGVCGGVFGLPCPRLFRARRGG